MIRTISEGIGGESEGFNERAVLTFSDKRFIYSYVLKVEISKPTRRNLRFPSLLGRDLLDRWRFVMDPTRDLVPPSGSRDSALREGTKVV
jgi:hypothetical protein